MFLYEKRERKDVGFLGDKAALECDDTTAEVLLYAVVFGAYGKVFCHDYACAVSCVNHCKT